MNGEHGTRSRGFFGRRAPRIVAVVALFVIVVVLLFLFLNWYIEPTKPSDKKDLVLALAQILGGTALLSGVYFTWRTLQVNREGQITERFTRAIDQLGKVEDGQKLFEIRVGIIYALERIARESEEDYWPIMEVLTAYVRQNARWEAAESGERTEDTAADKKIDDNSSRRAAPTEVHTPDPDVQAIMNVIGRRTLSYNHGEPEPLDLHGTNLRNVDLTGANLAGANLSGANLTGARLWVANFSEADLQSAGLVGANLEKANLSRAHLWGANFSNAYLSGADLSRSNLQSASLFGANLSGGDFTFGPDQTFKERTSGANLSGADLSAADLRSANFDEADLWQTRLLGADLRDAYVTQEQLEGAYGNMYTKLPIHLNLTVPAHWS